jgi:hypothetical protein
VKKLHQNSLLGQEGINLIERLFSEMGQVWRPTDIHDTGIDGQLEFRNPETGEVTNRHLQIQSKATKGSFESEDENGFIFRVTKDDLDYWLEGNVPVILIVSRPANNEAYWITIKDYFKDANIRQSRKITFDKKLHRFDKNALPSLWSLASPLVGLYQAPIPVSERLVSNLLQIAQLPPRLYLATAIHSDPKTFYDALKLAGGMTHEWVFKHGQVLSVHDLRSASFDKLCDQGTVEDFDTSEWAQSDDPDKSRDFVQLLSACLRTRLEKEQVFYQRKPPFRLFYFGATVDYLPRIYYYRSAQHRTDREVFRAYYKKKDGALNYYRHSAMKARFQRFDGQWYLEITPTYYFTYIEGRPDRFHADHLSGIKRLERNNAVRGQLLMWVAILTDRGNMFNPEYPFLQFRNLVSFEAPVMIDDESWRPRDEFDNVGKDISKLENDGPPESGKNENQLSF